MATIDLGKIKMVWRSAYNNATAYTIDDAVSYNGTSYICIAATTGNTPPNATYWNVLAEKGTDADLLNIASTAQGDIYYNNGSAIARLAPGTASQVLQTGGAGANPSWGTISSNVVLLASGTISSSVSAVELDHFGSTYKTYKMYVNNFRPASNQNFRVRLRSGGSNDTSAYYDYITNHGMINSGSSTSFNNHGEWDSSHWGITGSNDTSANSVRGVATEITFFDPYAPVVSRGTWLTANETNSGQIEVFSGMGNIASTTQYTGFSIYFDGTTIESGNYILYGLKS